jgi:hypothetical protein
MSFTSIIRMVKSKRMTWAQNLARLGEEEYVQMFGEKARKKETTRKTKT